MSKHDRVSTGSVGEKIIMRTSSTRGSVRETISRALRSTLRRGDKSPEKKKRQETTSDSSTNTSSLPRSASSSGSSLAHRSSSGFSSLSHLPPSRRDVPATNVVRTHVMSQSMYEKPLCKYGRSTSNTYMPSSPSLTTLKDFDIAEYDDYDDTHSVISTASTSRMLSNPRRVKKHSLRTFLDSPVRLRRREPTKSVSDAVEAGFEPEHAVPRCHSTQSISYTKSQFQPADLLNSPTKYREREIDVREYATPLAVVGPRKARGTPSTADHCGENDRDRRMMEHRRSLQTLNGSGARGSQSQFGTAGYSEWPAGGVDGGGDMMTHHSMSQQQLRSGHNTPTTHRRSVQNVSGRHNSRDLGYQFESPLLTSTPTNKVAVAPQQHSQKSRHHSHRERDGLDNSRTSHVAPIDRRGSLVTYHNERLVDGPSSSPSPSRVASLEQRVRELESMVAGSHPSTSMVMPVTPTFPTKHHHSRSSMAAPTQLIISSPAAPNQTTTMTQQLMVKDIVEKEVEIERLQAQLRKTYAQMEQQQQEYDAKVRRFKKDSETAKDELKRVINKLNDLDEEYVKYRERAASMPDTSSAAYLELKQEMTKQEDELRRAWREVQDKQEVERRCDSLQRELEYLELQNKSLNKDLDVKEAAVKKLEQNIVQMRMEASLYHQSCSSGSTPLAEDTESLAEVRTPLYGSSRPYTKAHSTLGASSNLSPLPSQKSNLRKSLSNYAIDAARKDDVTASMSQSLRAQQKKLVDSRLLTKCLKESLEMIARGKAPDMNKMLGIKADSMSESEAEPEFDSTAMTMGAAEKIMRRQEDSLKKLEQDLDQMRYLFTELYNSNLEDRGDDPCRMQ